MLLFCSVLENVEDRDLEPPIDNFGRLLDLLRFIGTTGSLITFSFCAKRDDKSIYHKSEYNVPLWREYPEVKYTRALPRITNDPGAQRDRPG
mmetsp:Transcript_2492/g.3491  ORF Transcript_2492/g.3491 Transcript_2492/m.3491 type:complete len:92 (+) Transcript_2492:223-498(+)